MSAISDAQARLDWALIESNSTAPIRAELAQLEQEAVLAAKQQAAAYAAKAAHYRTRVTARGASLAGEAANRINNTMAALAPAASPSFNAKAIGAVQ